jgi:hypothetical protein
MHGFSTDESFLFKNFFPGSEKEKKNLKRGGVRSRRRRWRYRRKPAWAAAEAAPSPEESEQMER